MKSFANGYLFLLK